MAPTSRLTRRPAARLFQTLTRASASVSVAPLHPPPLLPRAAQAAAATLPSPSGGGRSLSLSFASEPQAWSKGLTKMGRRKREAKPAVRTSSSSSTATPKQQQQPSSRAAQGSS